MKGFAVSSALLLGLCFVVVPAAAQEYTLNDPYSTATSEPNPTPNSSPIAIATAEPSPTPTASPVPIASVEPSPTPTPSGEPVAEAPTNNCCVCEYMEQPECQNQSNEWECTLSQQDCLWKNGKCVDKFESYCEKWADEQTDCETVHIVPTLYLPDPDAEQGYTRFYHDLAGLDLSSCTHLEYQFMGHANGCEEYINSIAVCMDNVTDICSSLEFNSIGCKVFPDLPEAHRYISELVALLGGDQCVTITGNQCTNMDDGDTQCTWATPYTFQVTSNGVCGEPAEDNMCKWEQPCVVAGQNEICRTENGYGSEICCCEDPGPDGIWDTFDDIFHSHECKWKNALKCSHPSIPGPTTFGPPNLCGTPAEKTASECLAPVRGGYSCQGFNSGNCFCTHCPMGNYCFNDGDCSDGKQCVNFFCS